MIRSGRRRSTGSTLRLSADTEPQVSNSGVVPGVSIAFWTDRLEIRRGERYEPRPPSPLDLLTFHERRGKANEECNETRASSAVPALQDPLCLRQRDRDPIHARLVQRGNLLQLPPLLHGQVQAARHRRPRGALPQEVRGE